MRTHRLLFSFVFTVLSIFMPVYGFAAVDYNPNPFGTGHVSNEVIIKFRPAGRDDTNAYYEAQWGITTVRIFEESGLRCVRLPEWMSVEDAIEIFRSDPEVEYAEPNYYCAVSLIPDDASFSNQWSLNNTGQNVNGTSGTFDADINAVEAWDISTGSKGIVVALVDSGAPEIADEIFVREMS